MANCNNLYNNFRTLVYDITVWPFINKDNTNNPALYLLPLRIKIKVGCYVMTTINH